MRHHNAVSYRGPDLFDLTTRVIRLIAYCHYSGIREFYGLNNYPGIAPSAFRAIRDFIDLGGDWISFLKFLFLNITRAPRQIEQIQQVSFENQPFADQLPEG